MLIWLTVILCFRRHLCRHMGITAPTCRRLPSITPSLQQPARPMPARYTHTHTCTERSKIKAVPAVSSCPSVQIKERLPVFLFFLFLFTFSSFKGTGLRPLITGSGSGRNRATVLRSASILPANNNNPAQTWAFSDLSDTCL